MRSLMLTSESRSWTGGQYSLVRIALGAYLAVHFGSLVPYAKELWSSDGMLPSASVSPFAYLFPNILTVLDAPWFVTAFVLLAAVLSVILALGVRDRVAALALWYIGACLFGRNPLIANPGLPYIGLVLMVHACLPPAPFGSLDARGRTDPRGQWAMHPGLFTVLWILMALGYSYSGFTKLVSPSWLDGSAFRYLMDNPLARPTPLREWVFSAPEWLTALLTYGALTVELAFAPMALSRLLRPLAWLIMLLMHCSLIAFIDFADLSLGMVMLHLFTFSPSWVKGREGRVRLFYDGQCGLCHRAVRFVLAEDQEGKVTYTPLSAVANFLTSEEIAALPDAIVLQTEDGTLYVRSAAFRVLFNYLGGYWRILGVGMGLVPRLLLDKVYDGIARVRKKLFAQPAAVCPIVPPDLRQRFETRDD